MEGTSGRARSGGNSAINTNIFRSVLQPCFDNHPLQRNSRALSVMRFLLGGLPSEPLAFLLALPGSRFFLLLRPPLYASHPPDLKYIDTLTHTRMNEQPQTGPSITPLFASPTEALLPRERNCPLPPLSPLLNLIYPQPILLLALTFFAS